MKGPPLSSKKDENKLAWRHIPMTFQNARDQDFPDSPVIKTLLFLCRGHSFNSWLGEIRSCLLHGAPSPFLLQLSLPLVLLLPRGIWDQNWALILALPSLGPVS